MTEILLALAGGLILSLSSTPLFARLQVREGRDQSFRDDGPASHLTQRRTPTTGGAVIVAAALLAYVLAHLLTLTSATASGLLVLLLMVGLGLVGCLDDYIQTPHQRSLGLRRRTKLTGQVLVATLFAVLALQLPNSGDRTPASTFISFARDTGINLAFAGPALGLVLFVLWANLLIAGTSSGVKVTDRLDGLAAGASAMVFGAYVLIGIWQFNQACQTTPGVQCYEVRDPLDLAVVAAAIVGACFGFLWWNAAPAKVLMGTTGSLALGGALAGLAVTTRTELLGIVLAGLFVVVTLARILRAAAGTLAGRGALRMTSLPAHLGLAGWNEVTLVIRLWIIAGLFVALGLGLFYAEWSFRP